MDTRTLVGGYVHHLNCYFTEIYIFKAYHITHFKYVQFILCELYLFETVKTNFSHSHLRKVVQLDHHMTCVHLLKAIYKKYTIKFIFICLSLFTSWNFLF